MADISIIIVNYNTREHLLKCLESVSSQVRKFAYKVYVIDNGSTDGSVEAIKQSYPFASIINNDRNNGFAKAVNQGLVITKECGYHLILNSDALLSDDYLPKLIGFMDNNQQVSIVTGQLLKADSSLQNSFDNFPNLSSELLGKSLLRAIFPKRYPSKKQSYTAPLEVESVIGAAMVVRQKAIESAGLLDEDYFLFLEETDWCYRMKKNGWCVYFVPDVSLCHLQGQSKKTVLIPAKIEYLNSLHKFYRKNYSLVTYLLLRIIKPIKILLGTASYLLFCILTLWLNKRCRERLLIYLSLLWWHIIFCSEKMTLRYNREK